MSEIGSVYKLLGSESTPHYHVVLFENNPKNPTLVIAVYTTTSKNFVDNTCTFNPCDDDFISEHCWVRYRNAKLLHTLDLDEMEYVCKAKPETIKKIVDGFIESIKAKKVLKEIADEYNNWRMDNLYNQMK